MWRKLGHGSVDSTDKTFVECLKEIERCYVDLSKPHRLRVEKWVEKLVLTSDSNATWRKHRNAYAKLLLGMVISKALSEPFHRHPPDGPLQSFPVELNHKFKGLVGTHESSFWRNLYGSIQESRDENGLEGRKSEGLIDVVDRDSIRPMSREFNNQRLLIREQAARIEYLECQLRDERLQHELQLQQLRVLSRQDQLAAQSHVVVEPQLPSHTLATNHSVSQDLGSFLRPSPLGGNNLLSESRTLFNTQDRSVRVPLPSRSESWLEESHGGGAEETTSGWSQFPNSFMPPDSSGMGIRSGTDTGLGLGPEVGAGTAASYTHSSSTKPVNFIENFSIRSVRSAVPVGGSGSGLSHLEEESDVKSNPFQSKVPPSEDDYMKYLERFQDEIRNLQSSPLRSSSSFLRHGTTAL